MAARVALSGHLWTVAPAIVTFVRRPAVPPARPFRLAFTDPVAGALALTGFLHEPPGARQLLVVLHGLGGSCESSYARRFASAAYAAGIACLRLNLRGADLESADFYHAGLTADLDTVLGSETVASFERVALVGFSLGGHTLLRYLGERAGEDRPLARGVTAAVAVCAPLDLELGATALDGPGNALYRRYLLGGLRAVADAVELRRPGAIAAPRAVRGRVRGIREWDGLVVAPRWGFASAEDYYARASAGPLLGRVATPSWIVLSENDPMVPAGTVRDALRGVSAATEVTWTKRGGHVGFPPGLDLGRRGPRGLESQLLAWLGERL
ncbi:MAG: hypothetical protein F9K18_11270 [Thermoanaerobaculia bacterium]|nr:MAG: hypothetical protein F9K18_11270 [Thermoanaerobaculia bacterium]